jgi:hypothetical protein
MFTKKEIQTIKNAINPKFDRDYLETIFIETQVNEFYFLTQKIEYWQAFDDTKEIKKIVKSLETLIKEFELINNTTNNHKIKSDIWDIIVQDESGHRMKLSEYLGKNSN